MTHQHQQQQQHGTRKKMKPKNKTKKRVNKKQPPQKEVFMDDSGYLSIPESPPIKQQQQQQQQPVIEGFGFNEAVKSHVSTRKQQVPPSIQIAMTTLTQSIHHHITHMDNTLITQHQMGLRQHTTTLTHLMERGVKEMMAVWKRTCEEMVSEVSRVKGRVDDEWCAYNRGVMSVFHERSE
jgi:hypothetical protein